MIIGVFGISGSGKDTIINKYLENHPGQKVHGTKVMMKGLGFENIDIWDGKPIPDQYYIRSENIDQEKKFEIIDTFVRDLYKELKSKKELYFVTLHLVVPKRVENNVIYQSGWIRPWFEAVFDGFVYLHIDPQIITQRKNLDIQNQIRDRGNATVTLESTQKQYDVAMEEWGKFKTRIENKVPYTEIENDDLEMSVGEFSKFVNGIR